MRKLTLTLAAAGAALAFAAPASAQYYPQPNYGYSGYGYNSGYNNYVQGNYGQVRSLQMRIDRVQRDIRMLKDRRMISRREYDGLRSESRNLEYRLRASARYGLNQGEARNLEYRLARLEQHVRHEVLDGNRWNGRRYGYNQYSNGYGYNGAYYADNDHDGRDDNDEHERWHAQHDQDDDD